jgi:hypothetical protein
VLTVQDQGYCFGVGPVRIRIERIDRDNLVMRDGERWYQVHGVTLTRDGADIGPRQLLIRGRRLRLAPGG